MTVFDNIDEEMTRRVIRFLCHKPNRMSDDPERVLYTAEQVHAEVGIRRSGKAPLHAVVGTLAHLVRRGEVQRIGVRYRVIL
jgi:hypothetical protein